MASDDENRRRVADQFARLGGRPRFGIDDLFSGYVPRGNPVNGPRPAKITAEVFEPRRFHVVPVSRLEAYVEIGWVSRAHIKSDGRPIAVVIEWPGAAVNPDDDGPHPGAP